jgi:hypothetical protein
MRYMPVFLFCTGGNQPLRSQNRGPDPETYEGVPRLTFPANFGNLPGSVFLLPLAHEGWKAIR